MLNQYIESKNQKINLNNKNQDFTSKFFTGFWHGILAPKIPVPETSQSDTKDNSTTPHVTQESYKDLGFRHVKLWKAPRVTQRVCAAPHPHVTQTQRFRHLKL